MYCGKLLVFKKGCKFTSFYLMRKFIKKLMLKNPEILIGGEVFAKDGDIKPKNIKKIFEEGMQSLINNLLSQWLVYFLQLLVFLDIYL